MNQVEILVDGKPVRQIGHEGRTYIVAKPGSKYEVRLRNDTSSRVMGVCSIDGLSVLDGEPCKSEGPGYVISGYNSYTIRGWRTSNDEVREFEFAKKNKSYAAKSDNGTPQNCGIIGVAFLAEKVKEPTTTIIYRDRYPDYWPYYYPYPRRHYPYYGEPYWSTITCTGGDSYLYRSAATSSLGNSAQSFQMSAANQGSLTSNVQNASVMMNSVSASPAEFDLGTKFSEKSVEDSVTSTTFKSSHILTEISIYYASKETLKKMGVPVERAREVAFPQAFSGFCKVPKE